MDFFGWGESNIHFRSGIGVSAEMYPPPPKKKKQHISLLFCFYFPKPIDLGIHLMWRKRSIVRSMV